MLFYCWFSVVVVIGIFVVVVTNAITRCAGFPLRHNDFCASSAALAVCCTRLVRYAVHRVVYVTLVLYALICLYTQCVCAVYRLQLLFFTPMRITVVMFIAVNSQQPAQRSMLLKTAASRPSFVAARWRTRSSRMVAMFYCCCWQFFLCTVLLFFCRLQRCLCNFAANSLALHVVLQPLPFLTTTQLGHAHFYGLFRRVFHLCVGRFAVIALLPLRYCRRQCALPTMQTHCCWFSVLRQCLCHTYNNNNGNNVHNVRRYWFLLDSTLPLCTDRSNFCVLFLLYACNILTLLCHTMLHIQHGSFANVSAAFYNSFGTFFRRLIVVVVALHHPPCIYCLIKCSNCC